MPSISNKSNSSAVAKELPPYGKELAERIRFGNIPYFVVITVGLDAWERAKSWKKSPNDVHALVLPDGNPYFYCWPVTGCDVLIERHTGPSDQVIYDTARNCLIHGAVYVRELFFLYRQPNELAFYDTDPEFVVLPKFGRLFIPERPGAPV